MPRDTYNMDEKGFMIGVIGKTKRVFDKVLYKKRQYKQASYDANREWVTVIGAICADGSHLPPAVIYSADSDNIQANWVHDIDPETHSLYFSVSQSGWTNDDLGVAWLKQVFDPTTSEKARRNYRLLILDGHGSHVTTRFLDYCDDNRILVLVYPPHATHTLQPLDISCFKPLSQSYSNELTYQHHITEGDLPVDKADFISLFWPAWVSTFTEKLTLRAFEVTGIHPLNPTDHQSFDFWDTLSEALKVPATEQAYRTDSRGISNVRLAPRAAAQRSLPGWQSLPPPSTRGLQTPSPRNSLIHALQSGSRGTCTIRHLL